MSMSFRERLVQWMEDNNKNEFASMIPEGDMPVPNDVIMFFSSAGFQVTLQADFDISDWDGILSYVKQMQGEAHLHVKMMECVTPANQDLAHPNQMLLLSKLKECPGINIAASRSNIGVSKISSTSSFSTPQASQDVTLSIGTSLRTSTSGECVQEINIKATSPGRPLTTPNDQFISRKRDFDSTISVDEAPTIQDATVSVGAILKKQMKVFGADELVSPPKTSNFSAGAVRGPLKVEFEGALDHFLQTRHNGKLDSADADTKEQMCKMWAETFASRKTFGLNKDEHLSFGGQFVRKFPARVQKLLRPLQRWRRDWRAEKILE
jgi:hypothetical protein